jgi:hypothetical protein
VRKASWLSTVAAMINLSCILCVCVCVCEKLTAVCCVADNDDDVLSCVCELVFGVCCWRESAPFQPTAGSL